MLPRDTEMSLIIEVNQDVEDITMATVITSNPTGHIADIITFNIIEQEYIKEVILERDFLKFQLMKLKNSITK